MRAAWSAGALALALAGCARPAAQVAAPAPAPGVAVRATALPRYVEIVGPKAQHAPPFLGVPNTNFFALRSWLDRRSGRAATQLYVSDSYQGPQQVWEAAYGPDGGRLPFTAIRRDKITCREGCSWTEDFAAEIPAGALAAAADRGFAVIFAARSGARETITVTPRQIGLQRAGIAAARRLTSPASAVYPAAPGVAAPAARSATGSGRELGRRQSAPRRADRAAG